MMNGGDGQRYGLCGGGGGREKGKGERGNTYGTYIHILYILGDWGGGGRIFACLWKGKGWQNRRGGAGGSWGEGRGGEGRGGLFPPRPALAGVPLFGLVSPFIR